MMTLPINLDVRGKHVVVVGGGEVAARKVALLQECGAVITVVSPDVTPVLAATEGIRRVPRCYRRTDLDGCSLVISATNVEAVNQQVWRDASAAGLPINVVDSPEHCTVTFPAVVRRGSLTVAISTGGASPALAAQVRRMLEDTLGEEYGQHLDLLAEMRVNVKASGLPGSERAQVLRRMADPAVRDLLLREGVESARKALTAMLEQVLDRRPSDRGESLSPRQQA